MSETYAKLEITPRVIDLGSKVVLMRQVASVGFTKAYPLRGWGIFLLIAAGLVLISAGISTVLPFGGVNGSVWQLIVAGVLAGAGLVAFNRPSRFVAIQTADGEKLRLASANREFLLTVIARIREAMEAEPGARLHTTVNITAGTIETNSPLDLAQTNVAGSLGAATVGRHGVVDGPGAMQHLGAGGAQPAQLPARIGLDVAAGPPLGTAGAVARNGYASGGYRPQAGHGLNGALAAGPGPRFEQRGSQLRATAAAAAGAGAGHTAASNQLTVAHSAGALTTDGGVAAGVQNAARVQASPLSDVEALIGMITRSGHPHQEALVGLLRVVEQHLKGGRVTREDAVAHWRSFAEYATQYLTGIDGVLPITERLQRLFGR